MIENDSSCLMRQICEFNIHYTYKWIFILSRNLLGITVITILKKYDRCGGCWIATYAYATNFRPANRKTRLSLSPANDAWGSLGLGNFFSHTNLTHSCQTYISFAFLTSWLDKIKQEQAFQLFANFLPRFTRSVKRKISRGHVVEARRAY